MRKTTRFGQNTRLKSVLGVSCLETLWTKFRWELGPMFVSPSGLFAVAQELNNSGFVLLQTDRSISKAFTFFFFFCSINKIRYSSFVNFQKYIVFHGFYLTSLLKTVIWCYLGLTDHKALLLMLKLGSVAPRQLSSTNVANVCSGQVCQAWVWFCCRLAPRICLRLLRFSSF